MALRITSRRSHLGKHPMSPSRKFQMTSLVVGLAIGVLQLAGSASDAAAATLPKDPCALLKPAEIQTLAPSAKIGSGVLDTSMAPLGVGCTYTWGPRSPQWGESALTITVMDASQVYPGVSSDLIQQGLLAQVKVGGPNASQIRGVGDAAVFTFEDRVSSATAQAYLKAKGVHLSVKFHAGDSLANKDKLIVLLKDAAARL
jgi:hypothetical protein